jgi:DNA polymerase III alpha subunit
MSIKHKEDILTEAVLRHGVDILPKCLADLESVKLYVERCYQENFDYPMPKDYIDIKKWNIPEEYYPNLTEMLYGMCETDQQKDRVSLELDLFIKNGMYDVLHVMKYIVDTLRNNNILWGVGRGSSVASYVLYLIGVHKIDSIKYNLPIEEFFKGEQNG